MIPKVIHFCWFSGECFPPFIRKCLKTWQEKMPDYELKLWDANSFDFDSVPFVAKAYEQKKWAFVTDYVRLYALYTEGGIYMDTDVIVRKTFNEFLKYDFFSSHEVWPVPRNGRETSFNFFSVQGAIMGGIAGHPYLKECLDKYHELTFDLTNHSKNDYLIGFIITPIILKYGYKRDDKDQMLKNNMMLFHSSVFASSTDHETEDSYAIHMCNGSWRNSSTTFTYKVRNFYPVIYPIWDMANKRIRKIKRNVKSMLHFLGINI